VWNELSMVVGIADAHAGPLLLLVGAAAGLIGGALGIGGGILMIPAMAIFLGDHHFGDNSFHFYKLAAITTSIVLSIPAAARHMRAKAVVFRMLPGILPLAVVGVVGGVLLASVFRDEHTILLRRLFGAFLEVLVLSNVFQAWRAARGEFHVCGTSPMPTRRLLIGLVVGLPAGFIAGMLGVGGGVWAVPAQGQLLGIRIRNAIANSSFMIICVAIATSISLSYTITRMTDAYSPVEGLKLALWLAPGALLGGWCGAGLTHRLPVQWLRSAFQVLLVVTGIRLLVG